MISQEQVFQTFFSEAAPFIDVQKIYTSWLQHAEYYDVNHWLLPLPPWAQRPYDETGLQAWQTLQKDPLVVDSLRPMCIYMHIPFCDSKCGFCDSYSFQIKAHGEEHVRTYVNLLCKELMLWSEKCHLGRRPVTTVHLGGGTPGFLDERSFAQLVQTVEKYFSVSEQTEWALETTVSSLTPSLISELHAMGFRRLHLGVQTLEDESRRAIGRRCSSPQVLSKICQMRSLGWVVSVDLICGLPFQTVSGLLEGIKMLIGAGTNGFSLYELLIYPQNRKWAERHGLIHRDHLFNYLMFQAGAKLLSDYGYQKNLFNHWADDQDKNIYFTFPVRGEDCLAVGAIADGVFGNYHYRHPKYAEYRRLTRDDFPGLEGGLRRTPWEEKKHPRIVDILSAHFSPDGFEQINNRLIPRWLQCKLIERQPNGDFKLTDSGSWFAGNMVAELDNPPDT